MKYKPFAVKKVEDLVGGDRLFDFLFRGCAYVGVVLLLMLPLVYFDILPVFVPFEQDFEVSVVGVNVSVVEYNFYFVNGSAVEFVGVVGGGGFNVSEFEQDLKLYFGDGGSKCFFCDNLSKEEISFVERKRLVNV